LPRTREQEGKKTREEKGIMGKTPVRLKEVSYSLSPMHHHAMRGLLKDFSYKSGKRIFDNWVSALFLLVPVYGSYWFFSYPSLPPDSEISSRFDRFL
jgi:hypothetical protein